MDALSRATRPVLMDTSQDVDSDGVVQWVASQSPNPALQALMKEAEREKRTRPSTPIHEHASWTGPLSSTASTSVASPWHSSGNSSADASHLLPLSGSSSSSLGPRGSESSVWRRAKPLSAPQRKPFATSTSSAKQPLASSTSSFNQPLGNSARPRSSSHSTTLSNPPTSYVPQEEEPEALTFIELLKDVSRQLDENAQKKQRLAARARERERERDRSLGMSSTDNRTNLETKRVSARPLVKTSSASAVCPVGSSTRVAERSSDTFKHEHRGRVLAKTASLGAPSIDLASGKSTPDSLPNLNLNCNPKHALAQTFSAPNTRSTAARKTSLEPTSDEGDSPMLDVIDLTETDTEWERHEPRLKSLADTTIYMQVDDDNDDDDLYGGNTGMDISFFQPEPTPQTRVVAPPKPKPQPPQPTTVSRAQVPTQRTRVAPPPLGMRRTPQLQPSQYSSTQGTKGLAVPRFKPPLLASGGGVTNKSGAGIKPAVMISSKQPPRGGAAKMTTAKTAVRENQDADSSFDMSFDVDPDTLEETMKAYDRIR